MKAQLVFESGMRVVGTNEKGSQTAFDTTADHGGNGTAASPMEVLLQATAACSVFDVISILNKKRKTITSLTIDLEGDRAETHPRVFTSMRMIYRLVSPDASEADLHRAVELSHSSYCSASAMATRSGCTITTECIVTRPS